MMIKLIAREGATRRYEEYIDDELNKYSIHYSTQVLVFIIQVDGR